MTNEVTIAQPATTTDIQTLVNRVVEQTGGELMNLQQIEANRLREKHQAEINRMQANQKADVEQLRGAAHKAQGGNFRPMTDLRRRWNLDVA